jgi:hypothetical protein
MSDNIEGYREDRRDLHPDDLDPYLSHVREEAFHPDLTVNFRIASLVDRFMVVNSDMEGDFEASQDGPFIDVEAVEAELSIEEAAGEPLAESPKARIYDWESENSFSPLGQ